MKTGIISSLTGLAALTLACGGEVSTNEPIVDTEVQSVPLASVEIDGDVTWQFFESAQGDVVVSELAPAEVASPLEAMIEASQPSAYELFVAAAGSDVSAPDALQISHAALAREGLVPQDVRQMSVPVVDFTDVLEGVHQSAGWQEYATNCSLASDGQGWFDGLWSALGWNYHWYYAGSASFKHSPWKSSKYIITHLCNVNNGPNRTWHGVRWSMNESGISNVVPPGYRSVYYNYGSTTRTWRASMYSDVGNSGSYKLGIMAP